MFGDALDPGDLATLMSVWIREDKSQVQLDLGVQPSIAMRRIFLMIHLKQRNIPD